MPRERILRRQWQDPTGESAILNSNEPVSLLDRLPVEPLSKFDRPQDHKGRRRLLKKLNRELSQIPRNNGEGRKALQRDMRRLEQMQFTSRITLMEATTHILER